MDRNDGMLLIFVVLCVILTFGSCQQNPRESLTTDEAKQYLVKYNYFGPGINASDLTDEDIEMGCRLFQMMANLPITGELDNSTLYAMARPRCGCEDIKRTDKAMETPLNGPQNFVLGSQWSQKALSWKITQYSGTSRLTQDDQQNAMLRAFDIWAKETTLRFQQVRNSQEFANIDIKFAVRRHSAQDEYAFDGLGGVLAHAFFPEVGMVHFDDEEKWVLGEVAQTYGTELYIVAAHEFGHALGLSHSNVPGSLMAPFYAYSKNLILHQDDIDGIQQLYGKPINPEPRPIPTLQPTPVPPAAGGHCNLQFQAAFYVENWNNGGSQTFVFADDEGATSGHMRRMYVHQLNDQGYIANSKKQIADLFKPWAPYRVDAAIYMPATRTVYLIYGTRLLQYEIRGDRFFRTNLQGQKYLDTLKMPQKPQSAMVMPYTNTNRGYYVLLFGKTRFWDWDPSTNRVAAWNYPISQLGYNFPTDFQAVILRGGFNYIFKNDKYYKFNPAVWRLEVPNPSPVAPAWIKGRCGRANI